MNFRVEEQIFTRYPNLRVGVIVASEINNAGHNAEVCNLLSRVQSKIKIDFQDKIVSENPTIAEWRKVYKSFGAKDKCSSIESLVKRVSKGKLLPNINNLVDLYNYISLKYLLPVGGEDLDKREGDLVLKFAKGDEKFIPLLETENNPPSAGEVIYTDDKDTICRAWNWREANKTKLTEATKNAIFVIESLLPDENLEEAVQGLGELISGFTGADCTNLLLDKKTREINI